MFSYLPDFATGVPTFRVHTAGPEAYVAEMPVLSCCGMGVLRFG